VKISSKKEEGFLYVGKNNFSVVICGKKDAGIEIRIHLAFGI